jgi:cysteine desulfurase/selenocysteine lyase
MNTTKADPVTTNIPIDQFPIMEHGLYANHAALAPWPLVTSQAVREFALENCHTGPEKYSRWLTRETRLREMLARLINAGSKNDIALLKNTTEGICTVASGIQWRKGDNLVLPLGEFPSNRLPWLALKSQGVEVREVDIRNTAEPEAALLAHIDKRTRLLAASAVQWTDGLRLQLEVLGQACRPKEVLFFVDAIQQLGAVQMDVNACEIDFLAADGHKWLLAPEGIAVFYCRESAREELRINQHGWHMVDNPYSFNRSQWQPSKTARRFEAGSPNTLGQTAFHASVSLLLEVGMQQVENCIAGNSQALSEGISGISGLELVRPFDIQRLSGIVSFRIPGGDPLKLHRTLSQKQLSCAIRGDAIRLSPHFYQVGQPVLKMLDVIEDTVKYILN